MAFENKQKKFKKVAEKENDTKTKNSAKKIFPSHAAPMKNGMNRQHVSYTIRPDLNARIIEESEAQQISQSALVERILSDKLL